MGIKDKFADAVGSYLEQKAKEALFRAELEAKIKKEEEERKTAAG